MLPQEKHMMKHMMSEQYLRCSFSLCILILQEETHWYYGTHYVTKHKKTSSFDQVDHWGWYSIQELRFLIRRASCQSPTWFADRISTSDQLITFSVLVNMISWSYDHMHQLSTFSILVKMISLSLVIICTRMEWGHQLITFSILLPHACLGNS